MDGIAPCLWFDHQAEEAATFYVSIFENSKITAVSRYTKAGIETHHRPAGSVMTVEFELEEHTSGKAELAMEAMLRMKKINIAELERATAEEPAGRRS